MLIKEMITFVKLNCGHFISVEGKEREEKKRLGMFVKMCAGN